MRKLSILLFTLLSFNAVAELHVSQAVVRLLPPGLPNTSAYMTIANHGEKDISLVGGKSAAVDKIELHDHIMDGEMMKMVKQEAVVIPAGESVHFKPGGLHLMLFGLKQPLSEGQQVGITLVSASGNEFELMAKVVRPGEEQTNDHHHHH